MKREPGQDSGFVSLVWNNPVAESAQINESRAELRSAVSRNNSRTWGGDCCDDGCEND
jgi:hypothetical protein